MENVLSDGIISYCLSQLDTAEHARAAGDREGQHRALARVLSIVVERCRASGTSPGRWLDPLRVVRTMALPPQNVELADVTAALGAARLSLLDRALLVDVAARLSLLHLTWSGDSARWLAWLVLVNEHLPQLVRDTSTFATVHDRMRMLQHVVSNALAASLDGVGQETLADWPTMEADETLAKVAMDGAERPFADSLNALQRWLDAMDRATEAQASGRPSEAMHIVDSRLAQADTILPNARELLEAKREELTRAETGDVVGARAAVGRQLRLLEQAMGGLPPVIAANFGILAMQYSISAKRIELALPDLAQVLALSSADQGSAATAWRALVLFADWAESNGRSAMACLLLKLAIRLINDAGIRLPRLVDGETLGPDDDVRTIYSFLTEILVHCGRLSEATEVLERRLTATFSATPLSLTAGERTAIDRIVAAVTRARGFDAASLDALVDVLAESEAIAEPIASRRPLPGTMPSELVRSLGTHAAGSTALLYYAVQPQSVSAIVRIDGESAVVPIDLSGEADTNRLVFEVLRTVSDVGVDPLPVLRRAHQILLTPLRDSLRNIERVVVCAPGALHGMPWAALHDGERFAIERCSWVRSVPAVVDLERPPTEPVRLLVCAATLGSGELPALGAQAADEVSAIAACFPGEAVVDDTFTRAQLLRVLPSATILHVISHFVPRPGELERSQLLLGDGSTITLADLLELDLAGLDLIVLAACRSGIADGDQASQRAFAIDAALLMGGGRAAVGNLWSVDSEPTRHLMTEFYRALADGQDKDRALAGAQRALLSGAIGNGLWRQPCFWAAPALSGNWRPWRRGSSRQC